MGLVTILSLVMFACMCMSEHRIMADMGPYKEETDEYYAYSTADNAVSDVTDDDYEVIDYDDGKDDSEGKPICRKGQCRLCHVFNRKRVCVLAMAISEGMSLELTVQRKVILKGDVTNSTATPICTQKVPEIPDIKSICLVPLNVSIEQKSACVNITAEFRSRKRNVSYGCFKIPSVHEVDLMSMKRSLIRLVHVLAKNSGMSVIERRTETDSVILQNEADVDDVIEEDETLRFLSK
ncbi:hypothetical protein DPMN_023156 [Dreissena polymorpha]|uniref:Uncharacterized protein n=1 Tax=Dreissena polymorpha TaxID=45954 RepID=A0A9D4LMG7_DREPO|nr:hypothetical protein DPMN_023156 [Dreissena polymorpha]